MPADTRCALVADVGGTNARFAVADVCSGILQAERIAPTAGGRSLTGLIADYLGSWDGPQPTHACVAVAGPVTGDVCRLTNVDLRFSIEQTRRELALDRLLVVNDFTAAARVVPELTPEQMVVVGPAAASADGVRVALGPGTGLGLATVLPAGCRARVLPGEGGHVALAGLYDDELDAVRAIRRMCGHVDAESVLSGAGLSRLYDVIAARRDSPLAGRSPADVVRGASEGTDPIAVEALGLFCRFLAVTAANAALTVGALGGVYLLGGILPRCVEFVRRSEFRARFEANPQLHRYLGGIPTAIVVEPQSGLRGALHLLRDSTGEAVR